MDRLSKLAEIPDLIDGKLTGAGLIRALLRLSDEELRSVIVNSDPSYKDAYSFPDTVKLMHSDGNDLWSQEEYNRSVEAGELEQKEDDTSLEDLYPVIALI